MPIIKIDLTAPDGTKSVTEVEARRFSFYIKNVQFWFAVHDAIGDRAALAVTHLKTGLLACKVGPTSRLAGVGMDDVALAKAELTRLIAEKGADRVYDVIRRAEQNLETADAPKH